MHPRRRDCAKRPGRGKLLERSVTRLKPLVKRRAVLHSGIPAGANHRVGVFGGGRHRLFAQNMLAGAGGGFSQRAMQVIRRGNVNGVQSRRLQKRI